MGVLDVTNSNFENEVLNSERTVLVDFWASWCGPCKMMAPVIEEISNDQTIDVKVCKVNVDEEQELAQKYGIMSIPTFLIFKNGNVINSTVGVQDKQTIIELFK